MRCIACGATMQLVQVVPAKAIRAPGYEHRSFKCSYCPCMERRLAFTPQTTSRFDEPAPNRTAPKLVAAPSKDRLAPLRAWARSMGKLRSRQDRSSCVTGITEYPAAKQGAVLVRLDIGRPDHLAPLLGFVGD